MDQHPIPQDVTGFQFKLIGTMTVKQFGYVASGVIMAVVLYYLPLPGIFWILVKVVLIPILGGSGAFIAFVPIEGRPVDVMAGNFFKAVFSPNQYVYRKVGRKFSFSTVNVTKMTPQAATAVKGSSAASIKHTEVDAKAAQLQAFLRSSHNETKNSLDQKEQALLSSLALPSVPKPTPSVAPAITTSVQPAATLPPAKTTPSMATPIAATLPTNPATQPSAVADPAQKTVQEASLTKKETELQQELQTAKHEEDATHAPAAHQKVTTLEKQIAEIHAQKQQLEQEIQQLKSQLTVQKEQPAAQPIALTTPTPAATIQPTPMAPVGNVAQITAAPTPAPAGVPASQYAKTVPQTPPNKKADLPNISDTPNVVVGIVKDPRGNILPNMLVEVKDKDGNPVRAFKTNALGQFASATPLAKGIYTIELDDPKKQHSFDVIQITANDQIMLPIEIISHDAREELRKQLFN